MGILIIGLYKADVLKNLYDNATYSGSCWDHAPGLRVQSRMRQPGSLEIAEKFIEDGLNSERRRSGALYFDYVDLGSGSVPLKVDLSGFEIDRTQYDEMHGEGRAEAVISGMRNQVINANKDESGLGGFLGFLSQDIVDKQSKTFLEKADDLDQGLDSEASKFKNK